MVKKIYQNICFSELFNLYHEFKMFKSKVPNIFGKNIQFFVHSANFHFTLITKFNLENRIFFLCPNVAGCLKNVFKRLIRAYFEKKNYMTSSLMWLGRESVQNVARARK